MTSVNVWSCVFSQSVYVSCWWSLMVCYCCVCCHRFVVGLPKRLRSIRLSHLDSICGFPARAPRYLHLDVSRRPPGRCRSKWQRRRRAATHTRQLLSADFADKTPGPASVSRASTHVTCINLRVQSESRDTWSSVHRHLWFWCFRGVWVP